ncbi:MAG: hypothetical protein H0W59_01575 [Chloroflexia bacterium]|nr:hypothetical protein [Chloroflexia bacterium]
MPAVTISPATLAPFGETWQQNQALSRTPPNSSSQLGQVFDQAVGASLAAMLGNIPIVRPRAGDLMPSQPDCVEVGPVRIVGGIRPQNFDVGYRPDGVRFIYDTKTLNDTKSVSKNWQNMVNDLATEAATVHSRFPLALVAFIVAIPAPCLPQARRLQIEGRLEGLARRVYANDPDYLAEVFSFVVWDPATGNIDSNIPSPTSPLRLERFHERAEQFYVERYGGLPPH